VHWLLLLLLLLLPWWFVCTAAKDTAYVCLHLLLLHAQPSTSSRKWACIVFCTAVRHIQISCSTSQQLLHFLFIFC
jgi:hypothetical protein